jgi:hypothetical protein
MEMVDTVYAGESGTGGLLIIITNSVINNAVIESKSKNGGGSGGGVVNIFYQKEYINNGTISVAGGYANGGNGLFRVIQMYDPFFTL